MAEKNTEAREARYYAQVLVDAIDHHMLDVECRGCDKVKKEATEYLERTKGE